MRIYSIPSKSTPKISRQVRMKKNIDGSLTFECSCPANVWFRVSNGRRGKADCRHIQIVKKKRKNFEF